MGPRVLHELSHGGQIWFQNADSRRAWVEHRRADWQDMAAHAPDNAYGELMADPREITSTSVQAYTDRTSGTGGILGTHQS